MFNVCDGNGTHVGFVCGQLLFSEDWQVALSNSQLDNSRIDWELAKARLADIFDCRNFWGKIKEDALLHKLKEEWDCREDRDLLSKFNPAYPEDYYKYTYLKHGCDLSKCIDTDGMDVNGYVFLDSSRLRFYDGENLQLNSNLDYIGEKVLDSPPIFGEVSDYPRIGICAMGDAEGFLLGADFSDFGGRNHTHITIVRIRSGNVETEFRFPLQIGFKKGGQVQIYLSESGRATSVFYDGAIYLIDFEFEEDQSAYSYDSLDDS